MTNPFLHHRMIVGYHGCDREVARRVLLEGEALRKSQNRYDWLGEGVYFWEHGPERALDFAEEQKRRGRVNEPFVLGAYIHLGRCFDLTDVEATRKLAEFHSDLRVALEEAGVPMPQNRKAYAGDHDLLLRDLDCAVLNFGLSALDDAYEALFYQTVRGVFSEGGPAFPGSRVMSRTHVQIAVRDPDCILGYFLPASYNFGAGEVVP